MADKNKINPTIIARFFVEQIFIFILLVIIKVCHIEKPPLLLLNPNNGLMCALIKGMLMSGIFFFRIYLHACHDQFLSELRYALDSRSEFLQIHKID
jgi:hypothetical protein